MIIGQKLQKILHCFLQQHLYLQNVNVSVETKKKFVIYNVLQQIIHIN